MWCTLQGGVSGILEGLSGLSSLLEVFLQDNTGLSGQLSSGTSQGACALPEVGLLSSPHACSEDVQPFPLQNRACLFT